MKIIFKWLAATMVSIVAVTGCKKIEVDQGFTTFGQIYFYADQTASYLAGHLQVKYNGHPIDIQGGTGLIRVPEGEAKFEFCDNRTDELLGEKWVAIVPGSPVKYTLFQPTENDPIALLDPNGQAGEEAAAEGFMKIKIANYATDLLPRDLDVVVLGLNINMETVELATLENVSDNLGEEDYRLVPTGGSNILAYTFKFRDRNTQAFVKADRGDDYWSPNFFLYPDIISPFPEKRVYTIYLKTYETSVEYELFIKSGGKYYEIIPEILYAD
ncbi:hypothetical protein SAMN05421747_10270 [Parapedobacter composti]|uniref:DUF4397 domain-containing protein n=1 Tax=Parapedobacter composti TaxID=623281 RepID=A0A1I1F2N3_9SPHI|nr:hypothetical protein [Parapedobacter composti]SFB91413.1 hypothetical protein SAMN05421747_10270 [Parapedobacter composti]